MRQGDVSVVRLVFTMSDYTAVWAVSQTLQALLTAEITNSLDLDVQGVPVNLESPPEMLADNIEEGISVWLYRVTRDPDLLNLTPERIGLEQVARYPIPVILHYLIIPVVDSPQRRQTLIGKLLEVFNDNASVRGSALQGSLVGSDVELRITLEMFSIEDMTRLWGALQDTYRVSLPYSVQVIPIRSGREPRQTSAVLTKESQYAQTLSHAENG